MIVAVVMTAGLAVSAIVYPSIDPLHVFGDDLPPLVTAKSIDVVPPGSLDSPGPNLMAFERPDIAKLVRLLDAAAAELPMETLVQLVTEYRLRDTVASPEKASSVVPVVSTGLVMAGSGDTSQFRTAEMPPKLLMLIEFVMQKASASGAAVLEIVADLVSTLAYAIGIEPVVTGPESQSVPQAPAPSPPPAPATSEPTTVPSLSIAPVPQPTSDPPGPAAEPPTAPTSEESVAPPAPPIEVQTPEIVTATVTASPPPSPHIAPIPSDEPSSSVPEPETTTEEDGSPDDQGSGDTGDQHDGETTDSSASEDSGSTSGGGQHDGAGGGGADNAGGAGGSGSSGDSSSGSDNGPTGVD
ncbi:MAG: hypothetical protein ABWY45_03750 [Mycobacterium sp.]